MPISVEKNYPEGANSISAKWLQPWLKENGRRDLIARISHVRVETGLKNKPVIVLSHAQSERECWLNATNAAILANEIDDDAEQWVGHRVAYYTVMGQNPDGRVGPQVRVRCADRDGQQPQAGNQQPVSHQAPLRDATPQAGNGAGNAYASAKGGEQPATDPQIRTQPDQRAPMGRELDDEIPF